MPSGLLNLYLICSLGPLCRLLCKLFIKTRFLFATGICCYHWKTSGSGSVQVLPNEDGRWFSLKAFTSYKLKSDKPLPQDFTMEFDIATHSMTSAHDQESA